MPLGGHRVLGSSQTTGRLEGLAPWQWPPCAWPVHRTATCPARPWERGAMGARRSPQVPPTGPGRSPAPPRAGGRVAPKDGGEERHSWPWEDHPAGLGLLPGAKKHALSGASSNPFHWPVTQRLRGQHARPSWTGPDKGEAEPSGCRAYNGRGRGSTTSSRSQLHEQIDQAGAAAPQCWDGRRQ